MSASVQLSSNYLPTSHESASPNINDVKGSEVAPSQVSQETKSMMGDNLLQKHHHHYQDDWTKLQNLTERSHKLSTDIREIKTKIKDVYNNSSLTPAQQNSAVRGLRKEMQKLVKEKKSIDTQLAKLLAPPVDTDRAMISNYIDSLGRGYLL